MGVNSLPKTVTRQRRGYDLKPGPSAPESSTLTTRLPRQFGDNLCIDLTTPYMQKLMNRFDMPLEGKVARPADWIIHCFVQASFFLGGNSPLKKTYNSPHQRLPNCALNLFWPGTINYKLYHKNFLLMDNKHRKLFVTKQSKGYKFMPKMQQNTFGSRTPPEPAGGAYALPRPPSRNGVLLLRGGG